MESRHLLNLSVQNALDCMSENYNFKNFPRGTFPQYPLESRAVGATDGCYYAHIAAILYLSAPPHKILRPLLVGSKSHYSQRVLISRSVSDQFPVHTAQRRGTQNLSDIWRFTFQIRVEEHHSDSCVNKRPIQHGFHAGTRAFLYSVDIALVLRDAHPDQDSKAYYSGVNWTHVKLWCRALWISYTFKQPTLSCTPSSNLPPLPAPHTHTHTVTHTSSSPPQTTIVDKTSWDKRN